MQDFSFFLFQNWLPVGVSAIFFFVIGLLFARMIWGRYSQRLSFAVEENLNLASQWSALGSSQRDLFKKLRSRWQADREAWEARLLETETILGKRDEKIVQLTEQLTADGKLIIEKVEGPDEATLDRITELEASLTEKEETIAFLEQAAASPTGKIRPVLVPKELIPGSNKDGEIVVDELQSRIRDLEQDLIDTHDELHDVREGYVKQTALVESLETRLIDQTAEEASDTGPGTPAPDSDELASFKKAEEKLKRTARQVTALMAVRNREIGMIREALTAKHIETVTLSSQLQEAKNDPKLAETTEKLDTALSELRNAEASLAENESVLENLTATLEETTGELEKSKASLSETEKELAETTAELAATNEQIITFTTTIADQGSQIEVLNTRVAEISVLERKKEAIKTELNDAYHEMYDVRTALRERLDEIDLLEARLDELEPVEEQNASLLSTLDSTRNDFALVQKKFTDSTVRLDELESTEGDNEALRGELSDVRHELSDVRHELSDVRMAYNDAVAEVNTAKAQMDELEAIIEDRSAEVNDLSAELRQQRDSVRRMKNDLAEKEGELEALNADSHRLSAAVTAKTDFSSEQAARIEQLEEAIAARYIEMNQVRVRFDEESKSAKYHASRADQLEGELNRRIAAFEESDQRIVSAEEALDNANRRIEELNDQIEGSHQSIAQLEESVRGLSREKDETLRELDRATGRISELEEAARKREEQLAEFERSASEREQTLYDYEKAAEARQAQIAAYEEATRTSGLQFEELENALRTSEEQLRSFEEELRVSSEQAGNLDHQVAKLNAELESAREERETARASIAQLEVALSASDDKTLGLSSELEAKQSELDQFSSDITALRAQLVEKESALEDSAKERDKLGEKLEARIAEIEAENERRLDERDGLTKAQNLEIESLKTEIQIKEEHARRAEDQVAQQQTEVDRLQEKLRNRKESVQELQSEISNIMMQRDTRDNEISLLKDKLRALEADLDEAREAGHSVPDDVTLDLEAALQKSLANEAEKDPGTSLDDVTESASAPTTGEKTAAEKEKGHHVHLTAKKATAKPLQPIAQVKIEKERSKKPGIDEDSTLFFNEAKFELDPSEISKVDQCARTLRRAKQKATITVVGYAGAEGNPDYIESLSARRADAVRERLLERGVPQSLITVESAGQDRRFTDDRARRVEMILVPEAVAESVN